jgi:dipeptidase E
MKRLLTSAGIKNPSIHDALVELLGKPISECNALCIPTASYGHGSLDQAWRFASGNSKTPLTELGWKSLGLLEITAPAWTKKSGWPRSDRPTRCW